MSVTRNLLLLLALGAPLGVSAQPQAEPASAPASGAPSAPDSDAEVDAAPEPDAEPAPEPENPENPEDRLDPTAPLDDPTRLRIFKQTEKRLAEVARREKEVALREKRLKKSQLDLELRIKALRMVQTELSSTLKVRDEAAEKAKKEAEDKKKVDAEKAKVDDGEEAGRRKEAVERLSRVFEKMKPAEIAKVAPEMDEDLVIEVLGKLKDKTTAKVLGSIDPAKAARLSEKLARLKKKQAMEAGESE